MKKAFSAYVIAYLVLLLSMIGLLVAYPKMELHLLLNSHHTGFQDTLFKYYSKLAEWPLYVLAVIPLLWKKPRLTIFYALCELTGGVVVQILKHLFHRDRPVVVFGDDGSTVLPLVEGVSMHHSNSFPSGHTSTFFVFFTCCALLLAYNYSHRVGYRSQAARVLQCLSLILLLALAALGGYSRIYLSQHFLSDVCVGCIIGFVVPCLFFYFGGDKILKLNKE